MMTVMDGGLGLLLARLAIQLGLAGVLALAGVAKLRTRAKTAQMLSTAGVPLRLIAAVSWILPAVELATAAGLLLPPFAWPAAAAAALMLGVFTIFVAVNLALGRDLDCNCFGQAKPAPITRKTLGRNLVLALLAGVVAIGGPAMSPPASWGQAPTLAAWAVVVLAAAMCAGVGLAVLLVRLMRWRRRRRSQAARLKIMASFSERADVVISPASSGLAVGSTAPAFALADADGVVFKLKDLLNDKRPILLIFLSADCPSCAGLVQEAADWITHPGGAIPVMIYEGGAPRLRSPALILHQKSREVADAYRNWGSPEAVWVRPDGGIGSRLIKGPAAIREALTIGPPARTAPNRAGKAPSAIALLDQNGRAFTADDLKGRDLILVFWDPVCPYCRALLDDLQTWAKNQPPWAPALVICTDKADSGAAAIDPRIRVVLDPEQQLMRAFRAVGTPTGVLLDGRARIIANAEGADAVMALANGLLPA